MTALVLWGTAWFAVAGGLSWLSAREHPLTERRGYGALGLLALLVAALGVADAAHGASGGAAHFGLAAAAGLLIFGVFLAIPFFRGLMGGGWESLHRWGLGLNRMKVERSYDRPERALREKRWSEAEAGFLEAAEEGDPTPWRRAGDARLAAGDPEGAIEAFRRALAVTVPAEDRASMWFRIADLERGRGDVDEAIRVLQASAKDLAGTRFADYAKERLAGLQSPSAPL